MTGEPRQTQRASRSGPLQAHQSASMSGADPILIAVTDWDRPVPYKTDTSPSTVPAMSTSGVPPVPLMSSGLLKSIKDLPPLRGFSDELFDPWSFELKQRLKVEGLWQYVNREISHKRLLCADKPAGNVPDEIRCKQLQASGLILLAISPEFRTLCTDGKYDDPTELWAYLKSINREVMGKRKETALATSTNPTPLDRVARSEEPSMPTAPKTANSPAPEAAPPHTQYSPTANTSCPAVLMWAHGPIPPAARPTWTFATAASPPVPGSSAIKLAWGSNSPVRVTSSPVMPARGSVAGSVKVSSSLARNPPVVANATPSDSGAYNNGTGPPVKVDASHSPAWGARPSSPVNGSAPAWGAGQTSPVNVGAPAWGVGPSSPVNAEVPAWGAGQSSPVNAEVPAWGAGPSSPVNGSAPAWDAGPSSTVANGAGGTWFGDGVISPQESPVFPGSGNAWGGKGKDGGDTAGGWPNDVGCKSVSPTKTRQDVTVSLSQFTMTRCQC